MEKSKRNEPIDSTHKKKCFTKQKSWNGGGHLEVGMRGIFASCPKGKEGRASKELMFLVQEKVEELYPETLDNDEDNENSEIDFEKSFENSIEKLHNKSKKSLIKRMGLKIPSCVFIKTHFKIDSVAIVAAIMHDVHEKKIQKSRFLLRLHPVSCFCLAVPENITACASDIFTKQLDKMAGESFAVSPRIRFNTSVKSADVVEAITKAVSGYSQHKNRLFKVDLTKPDLTIVVEVFKKLCGIAVVENYQKFKKFSAVL